ncbi:MAG: M20/M25/M40 family metallo-hydrolase [Gemmatimonadaceae bacterium]|nr:M20/M25/M40 family metallo-hydrolase [Gemmatimonadaceae bacterium]
MKRLLVVTASSVVLLTNTVSGQTFATNDSTLRRIWSVGMDSSLVYPLAQALLDSIGPRLTGTPNQRAANEWAVAKYAGWGIPARAVQYGTWRGWRRGSTHIDLTAPRVRSLDGMMLAWSPGSKGSIEGNAILLPEVSDSIAFAKWLPQVRGKFVLTSAAQPSCRPDSQWRQTALPETFAKMQKERSEQMADWAARLRNSRLDQIELVRALERAGAAGIITSLWSGGWGVTKVFQARTESAPTVELSCEDYGLVFRLAHNRQSPRLRVQADADLLGEVPVSNVIGEIKGSEKPDEYVLLSAHFDSWDGSSGATDNGTGTITMMEAMRILKSVYPRPKRTIMVGHWSGEEQGLNGSRAFAADNAAVVKGLQALFNQDNGTGRVATISMAGLTRAGEFFGRWFAKLPSELTRNITLVIPGIPGGGGSDYASFLCYGAPAFNLTSLSWDYGTYTWHTNRDTFDKIIFDELRMNATLTAMLAYLASEDPGFISREQRVIPPGSQPGGLPQGWPTCTRPARSSAESRR